MTNLKIYKENNQLKILNHRIYGKFDDFINHMMYKFINDNEIIRENGQKDYSYSIELKDNGFEIVYDKEIYFIYLEPEEIIKFKLGEYNDITFELKRLIIAFEKRKEKEDKKYIEEKKEETRKLIKSKEDKIIKDAKRGIFIDDEAKRYYLEYLKEQQNKKDNILLDIKELFLGWREYEEKFVDVYRIHYGKTYPPTEFSEGGTVTKKEKIGQRIEVIEHSYNPFKVFYIIAFIAVILKFLSGYPWLFWGSIIGIDAIANSVWGMSHFISIRIKKEKDKINNRKLIEKMEQELSLSKEFKEVKVSNEEMSKEINCVIDKLDKLGNQDKILILEKLKRVLELASLNNDNAMLRLNVIKNNLKYFEVRENTYMADRPKRKVLRPNINNISKKKYIRG